MLKLPKDLQLEIVDYLKLPSDLRALYQTSKELHELLIHRVFKKILINVRNTATVNDFVCSMISDNSSKLRHCRILNLWDGYPPAEALSMSPSLLKRFREQAILSSGGKIDSDMRRSLELILRILPENCLHTFRFISVRSLDSALFSIILQKQGQSMDRLQASSTSPRYLCLPQRLKVVDLWLLEESKLKQAGRLSCLEACPKVEELCLTTVKGTMATCSVALRSLLESKYQWINQKTLRKLSLTGFSLQKSIPYMIQALNFTKMTRLVLLECTGVAEFIEKAASSNGQHGFSLEQLALQVMSGDEPSIDMHLFTFLELCSKLHTLVVNWDSGEGYQPILLFKNLEKFGKSLQTLSLHDSHWDEENSAEFWDHELKVIYDNFPKLQQVGCRFGENVILDTNEEGETFEYELPYILGPFVSLKDLKIIHFQQTFNEPLDNETFEIFSRDAQYAYELRNFASACFRHCASQSLCPSLEAIVIGGEAFWKDEAEKRDHVPYLPMHGFVRGETQDFIGRKQVEATPISVHDLRTLTDYTGILDWFTRWDTGSTWMGRVPGRMNDD